MPFSVFAGPGEGDADRATMSTPGGEICGGKLAGPHRERWRALHTHCRSRLRGSGHAFKPAARQPYPPVVH